MLQGALLGVVGLILAFGLSLAVGRYEDRRAATVTEANAIGTTYLRAQLIAEPARTRSLTLLREYTDRAIAISLEVPNSRVCDARPPEGRAPATAVAARGPGDRRGAGRQRCSALRRQPELHDRLAVRAPVGSQQSRSRSGAGARGARRGAALGLLALHISVLGRGLIAMIAAALLVTLLLLVTFDLDRPTRGLITVPSTPLVSVRASMTLPPAAPARSTPLKGGAR